MSQRTLIVAFVSVAALVGSAHAQTIFHVDAACGDDAWSGANPACVAPDGPKATIQAAIDAAAISDGDEILVHPGTYVERIDLLGKVITLRSTDGPVLTIIDGDAGGSVITCANSEGPDTRIEGFTVTGGQAPYGGGMYNDPGSPTVAHCTFTGNSAEHGGGGMFNAASSPTLTNCTFTGNSAAGGTGDGGGMYNLSNSSPTLTNCVFSGNSAEHGGGGMFNFVSSPTLTHCTFSGNSAYLGGGMFNEGGTQTLANCIFWGNSAPAGPQIHGQSGATTTATYSCIQGGWPGATNIAADPLFTAPDDVHLMSGSPCIDAANNASTPACVPDPDGRARFWDDPATPDTGAGDPPIVDMGAYEFGSPSADCNANGVSDECDIDPSDPDGDGWVSPDCNENGIPDECDIAAGTSSDVVPSGGDGIPDECETVHNLTQDTVYVTIQEAIDNANPDDEIEVGPGTYVERINLLGKAITLRSTDGPESTIIDGDAGGSVITCTEGEGLDTVIEGFTITNGQATGGGGMYNEGSSPMLTHCRFSGNSANFGGGMYIYAGSPTLTHCTFSGNSANDHGGGMYNHTSSLTLTHCTFTGNSAKFGGGMYNHTSSPTLTNCIFTGNSATEAFGDGGGMYNLSNSSPTLTNCTFTGNWAEDKGGGMYARSGSPTLTNCTFSGNGANVEGAGMYNRSSSLALTNCTFSGNWAQSGGGGMYNHSSSSTLANCILYGNSAYAGLQIYDYNSITTATYSCIWGGWPGQGNISADPLFVDPVGADDTLGTPDDNLRLQPGSPCIDAGNNNAIPDDVATDFEGDDRIQHCRIDMGVDETPYMGPDCNNNGVADGCDVDPDDPDGDGWVSPDCNANLIPDECDIADCDGSPWCSDCNDNSVPDECDIDPSDPDGDGWISPDCNANGIPDECDLTDCNENSVPDECDVDPDDPDGDGWVSPDCNGNGIPDECDVADCDGSPWCTDCNDNGIPDPCDVASGTSPDVNPEDGISDECQGVQPVTGACCLSCACMVGTEAACLAAGGSYQGDGTTCETVECVTMPPGDMDGDGDVDGNDIQLFVEALLDG